MIEDIIIKLRGECSPDELSEYLLQLAGEYAFLATKLEKLCVLKAEKWLELRENTTSDTQAEREWERTKEGLLEHSLKLQMKSIDKLSSAIKSRLRIKELEAQNIW